MSPLSFFFLFFLQTPSSIYSLLSSLLETSAICLIWLLPPICFLLLTSSARPVLRAWIWVGIGGFSTGRYASSTLVQ
jgi:hypothetical protein